MAVRALPATIAFLAGVAVTLLVLAVLASLLEPEVVVTPEEVQRQYGDRTLLEDGRTESHTGSRVTITDSLRGFDHTVRLSQEDQGLIVDRTDVRCHGGTAHVRWHIGNLEPTSPDLGIRLVARLDGVAIGSILKGSQRGIYDDAPVELHTVIECPKGRHAIDMEVAQIAGDWGFPFVENVGSTGFEINRGFIVTEVWD